MIQALGLALICLASAVFFVCWIARELKRREPWDDICTCTCPILFLRRQDGDGHALKQFHSHGCPHRPPPHFALNEQGGYKDPAAVVKYLSEEDEKAMVPK